FFRCCLRRSLNSSLFPYTTLFRSEGIHSLVVKLGIARSLRLARWLHVIVLAALIAFGFAAGLGPIYYGAMPVVAIALVYEHRSADRKSTRLNSSHGSISYAVFCLK